MQFPSTKRQVPEADYVNRNTLQALVDFHEDNYSIPERFGILAHHVLAADALGDDKFLEYISQTFKVPISCIDTSNRTHNVQMALRDKMRLKQIVPKLESSEKCSVCKYGVVRHEEACVLSPCCDRTFHHSCLLDVSVCPYCNEAWGGATLCSLWAANCELQGPQVVSLTFVEEEEEV